tara:strand:- start:8 stop:175 length:168 start_codon:yes stop_codon:yes gene_type:complete
MCREKSKEHIIIKKQIKIIFNKLKLFKFKKYFIQENINKIKPINPNSPKNSIKSE